MPGNDALSDVRVLKNLATASRFGLDAVAIGVTRSGQARTIRAGNARVEVIPVVPRTVHVGARGWWRNLKNVVRPWYRDDSEWKSASALVAYKARNRATTRQGRDAQREPRVRGGAHQSKPNAWSRAWGALDLFASRVVLKLRSTPLRAKQRRAFEDRALSQVARERAIARYRRWPFRARWRRVLPTIVDDDIVLGRVLDKIKPDLIHVHDVFMMGVAAAAAHRAAQAGRTVALVYDAREYLPGLAYLPPRTIAAYCDLEREFIADFDAVLTVSATLAQFLKRDHDLVSEPALVLNAPVVAPPGAGDPTVRDVLRLAADVPLMVYIGGVNPARGVHTAIEALVPVPQAHLALLVNSRSHVVRELEDLARSLGVSERLHLLPFVLPERVPHFLSTADIGLSTLLHVKNHDLALTNKFCEYLCAGLPVITSDTPTQAEIVTAHGLGAVYTAGDPDDLARAVTDVLANLPAIRARVQDPVVQETYSWTGQAAVLRTTYESLIGPLPPQAWEPDATRLTHISSDEPPAADWTYTP